MQIADQLPHDRQDWFEIQSPSTMHNYLFRHITTDITHISQQNRISGKDIETAIERMADLYSIPTTIRVERIVLGDTPSDRQHAEWKATNQAFKNLTPPSKYCSGISGPHHYLQALKNYDHTARTLVHFNACGEGPFNLISIAGDFYKSQTPVTALGFGNYDGITRLVSHMQKHESFIELTITVDDNEESIHETGDLAASYIMPILVQIDSLISRHMPPGTIFFVNTDSCPARQIDISILCPSQKFFRYFPNIEDNLTR